MTRPVYGASLTYSVAYNSNLYQTRLILSSGFVFRLSHQGEHANVKKNAQVVKDSRGQERKGQLL